MKKIMILLFIFIFSVTAYAMPAVSKYSNTVNDFSSYPVYNVQVRNMPPEPLRHGPDKNPASHAPQRHDIDRKPAPEPKRQDINRRPVPPAPAPKYNVDVRPVPNKPYR